jgi:hypothetical protein
MCISPHVALELLQLHSLWFLQQKAKMENEGTVAANMCIDCGDKPITVVKRRRCGNCTGRFYYYRAKGRTG